MKTYKETLIDQLCEIQDQLAVYAKQFEKNPLGNAAYLRMLQAKKCEIRNELLPYFNYDPTFKV